MTTGHTNKNSEVTALADFVDQLGFGADVPGLTAEELAKLRGAAMALASRGFLGHEQELRALRNPSELAVVAAAMRLRVKQLLEENRPLLELSRSGATRALEGLLSPARSEGQALLHALGQLEPGAEREVLEGRVQRYLEEIARWMPDAGSVTVEETVRKREAARRNELARESERSRATSSRKVTAARPGIFDGGTTPPLTLALTTVFILLCLVFLATSPGRFGGKADPALQALTETVRQELPALRRVLPADRSLLLVLEDRWGTKPEVTQHSQVSRLLEQGIGEYDELILTSESGQLLAFWSRKPGGSWLPDQ